ncbi:MAG: protein phosphatase CheZ [Nitrospirota bacterium]|jgi:chemotaxis protein CheZ
MISRANVNASAPSKSPDDDIDAENPDTALYEKLGELTRFIDKTIKTISQFSAPMSATTEQLPDATTHLRDLRKLTEEGTHKVMQLVETVEDNRTRIFAQLDALKQHVTGDEAAAVEAIRAGLKKDDKPLIDIITALSFQDLVAQRVNKLVTIIEEVQHKLLELVVVFGPYTKGAGKEESGKAAEMLKQLEASKKTSMNQDVADEILKQFGFH